MNDIAGAYDGAAVFAGHGLIAGTTVACNMGWRPVEGLVPGDLVLTFDHGLQPVIEVHRTVLFDDATSIPQHMMPITIPAGAIGNRDTLHLPPEQGVMVESDAAMNTYGDPFAVVPAEALIGFRGIYRDMNIGRIEIVTLQFANPEVVYAEGGALVHCPQARIALADMIAPSMDDYQVLPMHVAKDLVDCMQIEDLPQTHVQAA